MPPCPSDSVGVRSLVCALALLLVCAACEPRDGQACEWPKELDRRDSDNSCVASQFLLQCTLPGGPPMFCTTSKPSNCSATSDTECQPLCREGEYGVSCGTSDGRMLPDGCRPAREAEPELGFFCCACL